MDDTQALIAVLEKRDDPQVNRLIAKHHQLRRAWNYLNQVNDHNMALIRDLQEEIKTLNNEVELLQDGLDDCRG